MSKHNFEAETGRILELLTHSIYSNKEIFLRELISNAADAIDKARLKALTDSNFLGDDVDFKIVVESDESNNIITISDNGIGMIKEELISHLGTIAKSGTKEFVEKLQKAKEDSDHNLIGQFGVGFYSSFMVADKVEVFSKSPLDSKAYKWISDGKNDYTVEEFSAENLYRGTRVVLYINEANKDLVHDWKLKELIKKYSNFVGVPIMMREYDSRTEEEKQKEEKVMPFEQINETKPIWKKSKSDITPEEYKAFYQSLSFDWNDPLFTIHNNVEGMVSYKSILFAPREVNMYKNLSDPNLEYGPKLYVQNVLILENAKELMPIWLRFVAGVIETNDLPLNISREMLQDNSTLDKIKKGLTKKVISELLNTLKNNREDYVKFWSNYGKVVKEGIHYEYDLKTDIAGVSLFKGINTGELITLDEYLEKAPNSPLTPPSNQGGEDKEENKSNKTIYYIIAKSESEALASPYLAQFREKNIDVLVFTDPIDSFLVQGFTEYKDAKLVSITSNDIELEEKTEEQKKEKEEKQKNMKGLFELIKNTIGGEKIEEVVLNDNLGNSLGALKTPKNGIDPQLEKMMKAMGQDVPTQKRILELNSKNKLVESMKSEFDNDVKSSKLSDIINYAYMQAILLEGGELENPAEFVNLTNKFASEYIG
ncbi:MAG: molecular chaperone HtpG [Candidatus Gracilibacteria bacterium]|nr:molecular chaperone HtpG [Candidatus Gracilibacteria bacterium]